MNIPTSLLTIGNGAAVEVFDATLQQVIENVLDENTDAKGKREITLKVTIKPNEERNFCVTDIQCTPKLQPIKAHECSVLIMHDENGEMKSYSPDFTGQNPNQHTLPMSGKDEERAETVDTSDKKTVAATNVTKFKAVASN